MLPERTLLPRLRFALLAGLVFAFGSPVSQAQVGIYGLASGGFLGSTSTHQGSLVLQNGGFSSFGGTFGVYDNFLRLGPIKLGGDARYFQENSSNNNSYGNKLHGGLAGLRLALNIPLLPVKPYLQAEVGGVGTNYGVQADDTAAFAYQIQGGLDYTIFPHLDLRAEYGGGQIDGVFHDTKQTMQEAGLGLVVRF